MRAWWERQHIVVRVLIGIAAAAVVVYFGGGLMYRLGYALGRWIG